MYNYLVLIQKNVTASSFNMTTSLQPALQEAKLKFQELLLFTDAKVINLEGFFFESCLGHYLVTWGGCAATSLKNSAKWSCEMP